MSVQACEAHAAAALLENITGAPAAVEETFDDGLPPSRLDVYAFVSDSDAVAKGHALRSRLMRLGKAGVLAYAHLSSAPLREEDWATSWKRFFPPFRAAYRFYIVPSWRPDYRPPKGTRAIVLDPGMAFGTGRHPTSRLALELLLPRVERARPLLDIGCGSGILGLAAALEGARVYASDQDSLAVEAARQNFKHNRLRAASISEASGLPVNFPSAPVIVANISADVLVALAKRFYARLRRRGVLIASGVTRRSRSEVLSTFAKVGLLCEEERRSGEWLAFVHRKL